MSETQKVKKFVKNLKRQKRKLSRSYKQNKHRKRGEFCAKNRQKQLVKVQKLHARLANIRKEYVRYVVDRLFKFKICNGIYRINVTSRVATSEFTLVECYTNRSSEHGARRDT